MGQVSKDDEWLSHRACAYQVFTPSILNSGWKPVCVRVHRDSGFLVRESEPNESFSDGSHVDDQEDNMTENVMTTTPPKQVLDVARRTVACNRDRRSPGNHRPDDDHPPRGKLIHLAGSSSAANSAFDLSNVTVMHKRFVQGDRPKTAFQR